MHLLTATLNASVPHRHPANPLRALGLCSEMSIRPQWLFLGKAACLHVYFINVTLFKTDWKNAQQTNEKPFSVGREELSASVLDRLPQHSQTNTNNPKCRAATLHLLAVPGAPDLLFPHFKQLVWLAGPAFYSQRSKVCLGMLS